MGLLVRILKRLYLSGSRIIQASLIDEPYFENQMLVGIANIFIIIALVGGFWIALYALVWVISVEIFVKALLLAYVEAWAWSKFYHQFTSFEQEMYLMGATVGYTVLIGAAIQINRMPWADGKALLVYWTFLLIFGLILWGMTVCKTTGLAGNKPEFKINQIEYKQHFRSTKTEEIPTTDKAQAYLKKMR